MQTPLRRVSSVLALGTMASSRWSSVSYRFWWRPRDRCSRRFLTECVSSWAASARHSQRFVAHVDAGGDPLDFRIQPASDDPEFACGDDPYGADSVSYSLDSVSYSVDSVTYAIDSVRYAIDDVKAQQTTVLAQAGQLDLYAASGNDIASTTSSARDASAAADAAITAAESSYEGSFVAANQTLATVGAEAASACPGLIPPPPVTTVP
jgi:hypothetical protein